MNKIPFKNLPQFRETFVKENAKSLIASWFPGHMYKGVLQMQAKLAVIDCIIEVHDARIPFSGRNPNFYSMLTAIKPHILVLNKMDLADLSMKDQISKTLLKDSVRHVLYTNCKEEAKSGVNKIIPTAIDLLKDNEKYNRVVADDLKIMVIGIPNVGKSSLINRLRNMHLKQKKAAPVGAVPGITKSVLEKIKVSEDPLIYLLDTPGIMSPHVDSLDVGLKLALCRVLKDNLVGEELIADYLLYWLNKHKNFSYVDYLKLPNPVNDIITLLFHIAKEQNLVQKIRTSDGSIKMVPHLKACAMHFISAFRKGHFGKILLDKDIVNTYS